MLNPHNPQTTIKTKSANSANQMPETGTVGQLPTRVKRRGCRLTLDDAREVAALCAKRCSEAEACATLGIPISSWHHWKARVRNSDEFREILDAIRGGKIQAHLANIEKFSEKDWRASIAYLEKTMPEKYSTKIEVAAPPAQVRDESMAKRILQLFDAARQAKVIDVPAVKQLAGPVDVPAVKQLGSGSGGPVDVPAANKPPQNGAA